MILCSGPECDREAKTRGLCPTHYQQLVTYKFPELRPIKGYSWKTPCENCGHVKGEK